MPPIELRGESPQGTIKGTIEEKRGIHTLEEGGEAEIVNIRRHGRNSHGSTKAFKVKIPQLTPHPIHLKFNGVTEQTVELSSGKITAKLVKVK